MYEAKRETEHGCDAHILNLVKWIPYCKEAACSISCVHNYVKSLQGSLCLSRIK
jgi:hypothetical protein